MGSVFRPQRNQTPTVFQTCNTCCLWKNLACPLCLSHLCLSTHNSAWNHLESLFWHQSGLIVHFGAVLLFNSDGNLVQFVVWDRKHALSSECHNNTLKLCVRTIVHSPSVMETSYLLTIWLDDWRIRNLQLLNMLRVFIRLDIVRALSVSESWMQRLPRTKPTCRSAIWCSDSCGSQLHIVRVFRAPKLKCFRERNVPFCVVVWPYMPPQDTLTHTCTYTKWHTETKKKFVSCQHKQGSTGWSATW